LSGRLRRNQQKLRRKNMGDSLVAGLRPEQSSNMGQHPAESWVLAWARLCRKGEMNVAQAKSTLGAS